MLHNVVHVVDVVCFIYSGTSILRRAWGVATAWGQGLVCKNEIFFLQRGYFYTFNYFWGEGYCSFYRGLGYIEVRYFVVSLYIVE